MTPQTPSHPVLQRVKEHFHSLSLQVTEFRGQVGLIAPPDDVHDILQFLREDPACDFDSLVDVTAVDYLAYPAEMPGRFSVTWILASAVLATRPVVRTFLDTSRDTSGADRDPALEVDSCTDIWPGGEWREREVWDMYGIWFRNHPDPRRILTWEDYPAFPLRKDYPLRGRGERELYRVLGRDVT